MVAKPIITQYVKELRKKYKLTQVDLSEKAGVGLRFVWELEQGKTTLRINRCLSDRRRKYIINDLVEIVDERLLDITGKTVDKRAIQKKLVKMALRPFISKYVDTLHN